MLKQLSTLSKALPLNYSARFKASDCPDVEDDEIAILLHGVETAWTIQCGAGYFCINEAGFEDGELAWMDDHGQFRTLAAAAAKLRELLESK
jgi:hypothetical protein